MKVTYSSYTFDRSGSHFDPELCMEPETDRDRALLENIFQQCVTKGHGRHADTKKLLHVRIALQPKEPNSGQAR